MTRDLPPAATQVGQALTASAGGYLRNTVSEPWVTCSVCCAPAKGYQRCSSCNDHVQSGEAIADRVATMVYAEKGTQTYHAMYGYKARQPQSVHEHVVNSLLALAIVGHADCDLKLAEHAAVFRWTTVPSTRDRARPEHPLHALVSRLFAPGYELPVRAAPGAVKDGAVRPQNCEVRGQIACATHVVVIDDSWVRGGSVQSVAAAVRNAGAASVSILAIARVLDPTWGPTAEFLRQGKLTAYFDYTICPWTGESCP